MFDWFKSKKKSNKQSFEAIRIDSASRDSELDDHWKFMDNLSINASLTPEKRRILRVRSRYEILNNAIAARAARLIVGDVIGTGARIQVLTSPFGDSINEDEAQRIEWDFCEWADAIHFYEKLASMRFARFQDGEAFGVFYSNDKLNTASGVKLDLFLVDAERVCSNLFVPNDLEFDGVEFDKYGNPTRYRILDKHPNDFSSFYDDDATYYDSSNVIHWFDKLYPEQKRGIPELTPCLNVLARLMRYQKAVLSAAETAANLSLMLYTDLSANDIEMMTPDDRKVFPEKPGMSFPIGEGTSWALPAGFKPSQLKAEQPTSTYGDFNDRLLAIVGGALNIPKFLITNSADGTTYAGGRLELQSYIRYVRRDQNSCVSNVLNKVFNAWYKEYSLINKLPAKVPCHCWNQDGFEHIDPLKEANAYSALMSIGATNLSNIYGKNGQDWENEVEQRAKELKVMQDLEKKYGVKFNSDEGVQKEDSEDIYDPSDRDSRSSDQTV